MKHDNGSKADLAHFTGTEHWYRHGMVSRVLFTDGVKYVADKGGAYWLVDEIALAQVGEKAVAAEAFQLWKLMVRPDHAATLTCKDGNRNAVYTKELTFHRLPAGGNHAVLHRQCDPAAQRVLTRPRRAP